MAETAVTALIAAGAATFGAVSTQLGAFYIDRRHRKDQQQDAVAARARENELRWLEQRRKLYAAFAAEAERIYRQHRGPRNDQDFLKTVRDACLPMGMRIRLMRPSLEEPMFAVINATGEEPITEFLKSATCDLASSLTTEPAATRSGASRG